MSTNTDNRNDLEYIKSLFDSDGIHAPESLSEDSMLAMLPDREDTVSAGKTVHEPSGSSPSPAPALTGDDFTQIRAKKKPAVRKWIAAAACVMIALFGTVQIYESVTAPPDTVTESGELYTFKDQSEIKNLVSSLDKESDMYMLDGGDSIVLEESATEDSAAPATGSQSPDTTGLVRSEAKSSSSDASGNDYSGTYLQVEEVDEADIVKTDGKYIYYVNRDREVVILSADNGKTQQLAKIGSADVENYIHDIFLKGDILVTVGKIYESDDGYTGIATYDISDRSDPKLINVFRQTGDIVSSRMVGNYVYLVTSDRVYKNGRIVPKVMYGDEARELDASDICCVPDPKQPSYIILSAADITSGKDAKCKTTAVFGASEDIYCNDHNLYCAVSEWSDNYEEESTRIVRASLDGLKVKFNATARVRGHIDDQFSMDEHDGYFRIATTSWRDGMDVNNLYVLDSKLKESGSVSGFARNESIRAVRYFGDKAYVITYEQIDPLFIIDLSDPARPKIEGEVKIDGFSTLLIPAGEGRLLGIGHATGDNGYGGEYASGLKLVLFDISDPSEPKVMDSKEFKDMTSPAQDTHKALTVNSEEGWYAVPYGIYNYEEEPAVIEEDSIAEGAETADTEPPEALIEDTYTDPHYEAGVLVFGADDELSIYDQHKLGSSYLPRSVYIGDHIYALDEEGNVSSFRFTK